MKNLSTQQFALIIIAILGILASLTTLVVTGHMSPAYLESIIVGFVAWLIPSPAINPSPAPAPIPQPVVVVDAPTKDVAK
jgi:hypothetical protein